MKSFAIGTLFLASASATTCGISGYDNSGPGHNSTSKPAYQVDTKATTPQLCSSLCKKDSKCKSFAVGKGSCYLYSAPTENNFTPYDTSNSFSPTRSPYYFYDASCAITASSPPVKHSNPICGMQGYDRGNAPPGPYSSENTREACAAACRAQLGCTAFAEVANLFTHRGTGCFYYNSLVDNFDANLVDDLNFGSSFFFTELSCSGV